MATWVPVSGLPIQQFTSTPTPAANYYLKFYQSGTTTPTNMATDSTGGTTLAKCQVNSAGYFINGSSAIFIPHIDRKYRAVLYSNSTDADADTFANAVFDIDAIPFDGQLQDDLASTTDTTKGSHLVSWPVEAWESSADIKSPEFYYDDILRFIPLSYHAAIKAGTNAADLSSYMATAWSTTLANGHPLKIDYPGPWLLTTAAAAGLTLTNATNVTLTGKGYPKIKTTSSSTGNYKWMTLNACTNVFVAGIDFDYNGHVTFGGVSVYGGTNINFFDNVFSDSNHNATYTNDRYAFLAATDTTYGTCQRVNFHHNDVYYGQTEFLGLDMNVHHNHYYYSVNRPCVISALYSGSINKNINVHHNTCLNPIGNGFVVATDSNTYTGCTFENINIEDNIVKMESGNSISGHCFYAGSAGGTAANTWVGINFRRNKVYDEDGLNGYAAFMYELHTNSVRFDDSSCENNTYVNNSTSTNPDQVFYLNQLRGGSVTNNKALNLSSGSITTGFIFGGFENMIVKDNYADAATTGFNIRKADSNFPASTGFGSVTYGNNLIKDNRAPNATTEISFNDAPTTGDEWYKAAVYHDITVAGTSITVTGDRYVRLLGSTTYVVSTISGGFIGQTIEMTISTTSVTLDNSGNILLSTSPFGTNGDSIILKWDGTHWREFSTAAL